MSITFFSESRDRTQFLTRQHMEVLSSGTRVHSVIFVISLKLNIFLFSASILTFSTQNHLILTYFTHFDTTHFFYKYCNINKASNSPTFFGLLYIMKFHLPRLKVASIEICVVSRVSVDMNRFDGHKS